jgi:hypothetical protein
MSSSLIDSTRRGFEPQTLLVPTGGCIIIIIVFFKKKNIQRHTAGYLEISAVGVETKRRT